MYGGFVPVYDTFPWSMEDNISAVWRARVSPGDGGDDDMVSCVANMVNSNDCRVTRSVVDEIPWWFVNTRN